MTEAQPERVQRVTPLELFFDLILAFAFAQVTVKTTLADVGAELGTLDALCLGGGPALCLLAYVALRVRITARALRA